MVDLVEVVVKREIEELIKQLNKHDFTNVSINLGFYKLKGMVHIANSLGYSISLNVDKNQKIELI